MISKRQHDTHEQLYTHIEKLSQTSWLYVNLDKVYHWAITVFTRMSSCFCYSLLYYLKGASKKNVFIQPGVGRVWCSVAKTYTFYS